MTHVKNGVATQKEIILKLGWIQQVEIQTIIVLQFVVRVVVLRIETQISFILVINGHQPKLISNLYLLKNKDYQLICLMNTHSN
jgi:hypothetical protein